MTPSPNPHRALASATRLLIASPLLLLSFTLLPACGGSTGGSQAAPAAHSEAGLVILNPTSERDYFHDFGTIAHGDVVNHVFQLQNNESVPVTIQDLQPSCSCSRPVVSYTDENGVQVVGKRKGKPVIVLPPGVVAEVSIDIDSRHVRLKNVDKLAQVRLRSDSENTPFLTFEMHVIVELAFQATPPILGMKQVPVSGGGHISTDLVTGVPNSNARIVDVLEASPGLEVNIDAFENFGEQVWRVSAVLQPPLELGAWQGEILLSTTEFDGEGEGRPFLIPVTAQIVEDIVVQPSPLGFTPFSPARGATASGRVLALAPGHRIKILDARIEGDVPPGLELTYEAKRPDADGRAERWDLTLTVPPSFPRERVVGKLVFELDDPNQASLEAPFIYHGS